MKSTSGFSLIEVLIALALTVVVLYATSTIFASSNRLYASQSTVADESQAFAAGLAQMSYELGLAGYRGTDLSSETVDSRDFGGNPSLAITKGSATDSITVSYYEDRWTNSTEPVLKQVTFTVVNNELIRTEGTTSFAIASGVENLRVTNYFTFANQKKVFSSNVDVTDMAGLIVEFNYKHKDSAGNSITPTSDTLFAVGFTNTQQN